MEKGWAIEKEVYMIYIYIHVYDNVQMIVEIEKVTGIEKVRTTEVGIVKDEGGAKIQCTTHPILHTHTCACPAAETSDDPPLSALSLYFMAALALGPASRAVLEDAVRVHVKTEAAQSCSATARGKAMVSRTVKHVAIPAPRRIVRISSGSLLFLITLALPSFRKFFQFAQTIPFPSGGQ
jgi:hypothetical protein